MKPAKKRTKPCHWCGHQTTSATRVCAACLILERRAAADLAQPNPYHELTGGAWVPNRRGVLVWQPRMDVAS